MSFSLQWENLEAVKRDFRAGVGIIVNDGCRRGSSSAAVEGARYAKANHEWKNQTHELEDSIRAVTGARIPNGGEAMFEATAKHASYMEEGTPRHEIKVKHAPFLAFWWEREGFFFEGLRVDHPGTKPMPFMGPAYLKAERFLLARIVESVPAAQRMLDR